MRRIGGRLAKPLGEAVTSSRNAANMCMEELSHSRREWEIYLNKEKLAGELLKKKKLHAMWVVPDKACLPSLGRIHYLGEMPELSTFLLYGEEDNLHVNCSLTMTT